MRYLIILVLLLATHTPSAWAITSAEYCQSPQEVEMLGYVNQYRVANGAPPLREVAVIGAAARHHAVDAITQWESTTPPFWSGHGMSDGTDFAQNMIAHGYTAGAWMGENATLRGPDAVYGHFLAYMYSPHHNENMLNPDWRVVGIGWQDDATTSVSYLDFGTSVNPDVDASYITAPVCGGQSTSTPGPTRTPANTPTPAFTPTPKKCPTKNPHYPNC